FRDSVPKIFFVETGTVVCPFIRHSLCEIEKIGLRPLANHVRLLIPSIQILSPIRLGDLLPFRHLKLEHTRLRKCTIGLFIVVFSAGPFIEPTRTVLRAPGPWGENPRTQPAHMPVILTVGEEISFTYLILIIGVARDFGNSFSGFLGRNQHQLHLHGNFVKRPVGVALEEVSQRSSRLSTIDDLPISNTLDETRMIVAGRAYFRSRR